MVVRLLMAMGYGGVAGHGTVTGKTGDGGIDGVRAPTTGGNTGSAKPAVCHHRTAQPAVRLLHTDSVEGIPNRTKHQARKAPRFSGPYVERRR